MARSFSNAASAAGAGFAIVALLSGCGAPREPAPDVAARAADTGAAPASGAEPRASAPGGSGFQHRRGELLNPDASAVVMLYFDLAGITAPIDQWVENDARVSMARPTEKPAMRDTVRSELEAMIEGVRDVGVIRLSMQANLSEYDATYGEFTVRAFAPSSVVEFKEFGQVVGLKFGNARAAQVWRVPADQAQGVLDRIGHSANVTADALLRVRDVHAAPSGGTLTADVIEYELRENRGGTLLGRVQPAPQP